MSSLFLLIPLSIVLISIAICVFIWAVRNRQFEDLDKEAHRILFDDDDQEPRDPDRNQRDKERDRD